MVKSVCYVVFSNVTHTWTRTPRSTRVFYAIDIIGDTTASHMQKGYRRPECLRVVGFICICTKRGRNAVDAASPPYCAATQETAAASVELLLLCSCHRHAGQSPGGNAGSRKSRGGCIFEKKVSLQSLFKTGEKQTVSFFSIPPLPFLQN